jgi:hypothetical protein
VATFYAKVSGKVYGPFDAAKLKKLAAAEKLSRNDEISRDGRTGWVKAGGVKGLFLHATIAPKRSQNLRPCSDCGGLVSIHANACPHCGCPTDATTTSGSSNLRRRIGMVLVATVLLGGTAFAYSVLQSADPDQARQRAFAVAIEAAELASLESPDLESLDEADSLAVVSAEKSRVRKLRTAIAATAPVVTLVRAYNKKDISLMISQLDSKFERGKGWADWIIKRLPYTFGVDLEKLLKVVPWLAPFAGNTLGTSQLTNLHLEMPSFDDDGANVEATMDHRQTLHGEGTSHLKIKFTLQREAEPFGWRIHWAESLLHQQPQIVSPSP